MGNMHLVIVFLWAGIKGKPEGNCRDEVGESQLLEILPETDDERHYEEVREIEQIFTGPEPFHIVHDNQVKVQVQNGYHTGKRIFAS